MTTMEIIRMAPDKMHNPLITRFFRRLTFLAGSVLLIPSVINGQSIPGSLGTNPGEALSPPALRTDKITDQDRFIREDGTNRNRTTEERGNAKEISVPDESPNDFQNFVLLTTGQL